jgi:hypothetical protein
MPLLLEYLDLIKDGQIRNNAMQSSGWLILAGHDEYAEFRSEGHMQWKVGSIEPTDSIHGDIEYLYEINVSDQTIKINGKFYKGDNLENYENY